jgi:putative peptide zinc metalloprotease protein
VSTVRELDTSERTASYLLQGRNQIRMRLAPAAMFLLEAGRRGRPPAALAAGLSELTGRPVTAAEAQEAYRLVDERVRQIEAKPPRTPAGFWFRAPLIPGGIVLRIAHPLSALFAPTVAVPLVALGLLAVLLALRAGRSLQPGADYLIAYCLFLLSLLAHEFGHAAACARYRGRPSAIGLALYVVYPVLYSDVSDAWSLRRWQRVVVDLGGIYFQSLVGAVFLAAYALSGWRPLTLAALLVAISCLFSLNPFFKFDGYWVLGDALGVVSLGRQRARLLAHARRRLGGKPADPLPWPAPVTAFVVAYSVAATAVWVVFLVLVVPFLVGRALAFPSEIAHDVPLLVQPGHALSAAATESLLFAALAVLTLGTTFVRLSTQVAARLWGQRSG